MAKAKNSRLLLAAAAAVGLYLLMRGKGAKPQPRVWVKSLDGWLPGGATVRASTVRAGAMSAQQIAGQLAGEMAFQDVKVYVDTMPADWPAEDGAAGRVRVEFRLAGPTTALWLAPAAVPAWVAQPGPPLAGNRAPPTDSGALMASGIVTAIIAGAAQNVVA